MKRVIAGVSISARLNCCRSTSTKAKPASVREQQRDADQHRHLADQALRKQPPHSAPHLGGERVAAAPDGLDQFGIARVGFDLLAQPADVIVDAALEGGELAALAEVEQLVAGEHALRVGDEGEQEIILAGRERDRAPVLADQLALAGPQHPVAEGVGVGVGRAHAVVRRCGEAPP